jgi:hypothetical protein
LPEREPAGPFEPFLESFRVTWFGGKRGLVTPSKV